MHSSWQGLRRLTTPWPSLGVAAWALGARWRARCIAHASGLNDLQLPRSPARPASQVRTVRAVLRLTGATCLIRSAVLQRWYADHGRPVDIVVGVTPPSGGFRAHAWLDFPEEQFNLRTYSVIARVPSAAPRG